MVLESLGAFPMGKEKNTVFKEWCVPVPNGLDSFTNTRQGLIVTWLSSSQVLLQYLCSYGFNCTFYIFHWAFSLPFFNLTGWTCLIYSMLWWNMTTSTDSTDWREIGSLENLQNVCVTSQQRKSYYFPTWHFLTDFCEECSRRKKNSEWPDLSYLVQRGEPQWFSSDYLPYNIWLCWECVWKELCVLKQDLDLLSVLCFLSWINFTLIGPLHCSFVS